MTAIPTSPPPPKREITLRTQSITDDDVVLIKDLDAVAHLKRTTRSQVVADLIKKTLGDGFADQIKAA